MSERIKWIWLWSLAIPFEWFVLKSDWLTFSSVAFGFYELTMLTYESFRDKEYTRTDIKNRSTDQ